MAAGQGGSNVLLYGSKAVNSLTCCQNEGSARFQYSVGLVLLQRISHMYSGLLSA